MTPTVDILVDGARLSVSPEAASLFHRCYRRLQGDDLVAVLANDFPRGTDWPEGPDLRVGYELLDAIALAGKPGYKQADPFLTSFEWRRVRMIALRRDGAKCACCGRTSADGVRIHVDHIKPRRRYPELALDVANLQVLCEECNHGKGSAFDDAWRTETAA